LKYKSILFDFDGTLADTLPVCFYSFQMVFNKYDSKILTNEEIISMFGPSEVGIIQQNLQNKDRIDEAIEDYYYYYEREHRNLAGKNNAVIDMIRLLQQKGFQIGIVTGKARRSYETSVKYLFPNEMFKVSITGDDVEVPKPHPEGIIKAINILGSTAQETLYVGDSNADIEAGIRANVETVGVNWLNNSHGNEFQIKPDYEFTRISDFIRKILDR
jgi:pyrophosphatase PpaX